MADFSNYIHDIYPVLQIGAVIFGLFIVMAIVLIVGGVRNG